MVLIDLYYTARLYRSLSYIGSIGQVPLCVIVGKLPTPSQALPWIYLGLGAASIFEMIFKRSLYLFSALTLAHSILILVLWSNLFLSSGYCRGANYVDFVYKFPTLNILALILFLIPCPAIVLRKI
jgi:hypothetical protein